MKQVQDWFKQRVDSRPPATIEKKPIYTTSIERAKAVALEEKLKRRADRRARREARAEKKVAKEERRAARAAAAQCQ